MTETETQRERERNRRIKRDSERKILKRESDTEREVQREG